MKQFDRISGKKKYPLLVFDPLESLSDLHADQSLADWHCLQARSLDEAINILKREHIQVAVAALCDHGLQPFNDIEHLNRVNGRIQWIAILPEKIGATSPSCPCPHSEFAATLTHYCLDYHHLPVDRDRLTHTLGHAYGIAMLQHQAENSKDKQGQLTRLIGHSKAIQKLTRAIDKIAAVDAPVLISGETGTGKGLCAQLIHRLSSRCNGPMITINCAALPPGLIHSELFGHEKGAFTGAQKRYIGHIERADHGTLFLDEIGDLPLEQQANLLQFLEERHIERIGGSQTLAIDCRIIFASHVDLESAIEEGKFREDLYHRLNILRLHVPSLRDRKDDILAMVTEFLNQYSPNGKRYHLSEQAMAQIQSYDWPGNVRELKNRLQRAIAMADSPVIGIEELNIGKHITKNNIRQINNQEQGDLAEKRLQLDTEFLLAAIERNDHNMSAAARELNISRATLYRMVKRCNISL